MKDFCHFVMIPFTGLGLKGGYRGDDWFKYRISIFKKYTLQSLLNQTCRDFVIWISFRPEEEINPIAVDFKKYMEGIGQPFIFTYGGLCFYDDKFNDVGLLNRLRKTLPKLKDYIENKKYVLETLQPSDDMFATDEMENIQNEDYEDNKALTHDKGYVIQEETQRVADWVPATNPPFYTIMYSEDVFLDADKHLKYLQGFKSHEDIVRIFKCKTLLNGKYCVLTHGKNISTNWWHPFRGHIYSAEESKEILKNFGIKPDKTFVILAGLMVVLRYYLVRILIKTGFYKYAKAIKVYFTNKT